MTRIEKEGLEQIAMVCIETAYKTEDYEECVTSVVNHLADVLRMNDEAVHIYTTKEVRRKYKERHQLETSSAEAQKKLIDLKEKLTQAIEDIHMANTLR